MIFRSMASDQIWTSAKMPIPVTPIPVTPIPVGQTFAGRYLFSVITYFGKSRGYAVTARDMTKNGKTSRYTRI